MFAMNHIHHNAHINFLRYSLSTSVGHVLYISMRNSRLFSPIADNKEAEDHNPYKSEGYRLIPADQIDPGKM